MMTTTRTIRDDNDAVCAGVESCSDAWGEVWVPLLVTEAQEKMVRWRGRRLLGNRAGECTTLCGEFTLCGG